MGVHLFDQYSLLHFAVGVIAYFWDVPFLTWMLLHALFEFLENTITGMHIINQFPLWPGGKPMADACINILGDNFSAAMGWLIAAWLDVALQDPYL